MTLELLWPGKYDAAGRRAPIPRFGDVVRPIVVFPGSDPARLVEGDNLRALDALDETLRGRVNLVYLDPPFATGSRFALQTRVGSGKRGPEVERFAYDDRFDGGVEGLVRMLDPRLRLLHELLAPDGSLYVHVDPIASHAVKLLLDEIFGADGFQREIVWRIGWVSGFKTRARNWIRNHDVILFYTKDPRQFTFNKLYTPYPAGYRRRDGALPTGQGVPVDDVWNANEAEFALRGRDSLDSIQIKSFSTEKSGYATQKNESLLRRIVAASSQPGDLVLDPFCGSGTTGVAAVELGRRFIGCDSSHAALHVAKKRLLSLSCGRGLVLERVVRRGAATATVESPNVSVDSSSESEGSEARGPLADADPERAATESAAPADRSEPRRSGAGSSASGEEAASRRSGAGSAPPGEEAASRCSGAGSARPGNDSEACHASSPGSGIAGSNAASDASPPSETADSGAVQDASSPRGSSTAEVVARRIEGASDAIEVELRNFEFGPEVAVPSAVHVAVESWSDLLDAWWIAVEDDPPRVLFHAFRTHRERALTVVARVSVEPTWSRLRVRLTDVLGGEVDVVLTPNAVQAPNSPAAGNPA